MADNREVVQPPPNNNDEPANNNESNDGAIDRLLESMSINENEMISPSDEELFKQPPPREDCPICFLTMPSLWTGYHYRACCGQVICSGCIYACDCLGDQLCPFCRTQPPSTKEIVGRMEKRIKAKDSLAVYGIGCFFADGLHGLPKDSAKAIKLWHRAGELGNAEAYHNIGSAYINGEGVERDLKKAVYYWELAAMGGDAMPRYNLGVYEEKEGNMDRALKHFMFAVRGGFSDSLTKIKELYTNGHVTKDDYAKALRAYQAYVDEIKSTQRDEAAAYDKQYKYYYQN